MSTTTEELPIAPSAPVTVTGDVWHAFRARYTPLAATAAAVSDPKIARATRLAIREVRCEMENARKEAVAGLNKELGEINEKARGIRLEMEDTEARLREIEEAAEREAAKRKQELRDARGEMLEKFGIINNSMYALGDMSQDDFDALHDGLKAAHEQREKAKLEAEHARLLKEKAEAEERERIRVENERLRAEATEKEAALKAERERVAAEQRAAEARVEKAVQEQKAAAEIARKEREAVEARAKAEQEKREREHQSAMDAAEAKRKAEQAEHEKKFKAELAKKKAENDAKLAAAQDEARRAHEAQDAAEAVAREERAAAHAREAKQKYDREMAERERAAAAKAPDREKLIAFAGRIRSLEFPALVTEDGKTVLAEIETQIGKFAAWVEKKAGAM